MPAERRSLAITDAYRGDLALLTRDAEYAARRSWKRLSWDDLDRTYVPIQAEATMSIERAQREAVRLTAGYLGAYISSELGRRVATPRIPAKRYVGRSVGGRSISDALASPLIKVKVANAAGEPNPLGTGLVAMLAAVDLNIKHAARRALADQIKDDPRIDGWRRAVAGTCGACSGLATESKLPPGTELHIHPHCQCVAEPSIARVNERYQRLGGQRQFDSLTWDDQNAALGFVRAQLVREGRVRWDDLADDLGDGYVRVRTLADLKPRISNLAFEERLGRTTRGLPEEKVYQDLDDFEKLYARAQAEEQALREFLDLGRGLEARLNARAVIEPSMDASKRLVATQSRPQVVLVKPKKYETALEKVEVRGKQVKELKDLNRASIIVRGPDELSGAFAELRAYAQERGWSIHQVENGFTGEGVFGYRDLSVILRSPTGHYSELQFHINTLWRAKYVRGHDWYDEMRLLNPKVKDGTITPTESARLAHLQDLSKELYDDAFKRAGGTVKVDAAAFKRAINKVQRDPDRGPFLTNYSTADYAEMDVFLGNGGKTGAAVRELEDGSIEVLSLFNAAGAPKYAGRWTVNRLIEGRGVNRLDCIGDGLRDIYKGQGFRVKKTIKWDDKYAPDGWKYEEWGRPNIYVMERPPPPKPKPRAPEVSPEATPVREVVSESHAGPGTDVADGIVHATKIIDEVHALPAGADRVKIATILRRSGGANGTFSGPELAGTIDQTLARIRLRATGWESDAHAAGTFSHEFGHYIDDLFARLRIGQDTPKWLSEEAMLSVIRGQPGRSLAAEPFEPIMRAILHSRAYGRLVRLDEDGSYIVRSGTPEIGDRQYVGYLAKPREVFARAYAQWIGLRGGIETYYRPGIETWTDEDFAPIAEAFDEAFEGLGLLKKRKP